MKAVRERHDPLHSTPDSRKRHRRRYLYAIELAREYVEPGGTWWDVACGYGYGTVLMPGETVVGVDRDRHSLGEAAQRCPDAHFTQADVTSAGWVSELVQFGRPRAVLSIETLEHLDTWGQDSLLAQAAESLEEGGVFVLACPIGDGPSANPWHKHEPTEAELRALLLRHFGEVLHFETDDYVSTSGPAVQAFCVCYAE